MTRNSALKVLNLILAVLLLNQAVTGGLHEMLAHKTFEIMHGGGAALFLFCAALHVILNWNWVKANLFRRPPNEAA
ncbi:MAG: hypothetical protein RDV41_09105 [Planctomycetota bacterium]|nr:hypothetical protein [Planctomycetota bacterium]